ncbi:MAG TPA: CDP-diacylglycerol--glycerol-3-phosphate 3-phosphatidyltransferase [Candidatus Coprovicinus avistercoris]|uniref:CDP-diacylglycerol--glycerol-3-phosphate 3-phosphatidyltransferase n=1 Tax=Candidatus Coprovicinus avistercoris TaxID=2840754 RepID=A0A9D1HXA3_9ACTN|nr:CDP-diacylglycerol--glycerol-3-phosphate 3-phosphatidyltransferase [Candidatus Coprovicinus avistercoris]
MTKGGIALTSSATAPKRGIKWTPANIVTTIRIVFIPLWLLVAELVTVQGTSEVSIGGIVVFAFYALLSLTDKVDGYLARSRGEVTVFGKFIDPIADKLLVVTGMVWLLTYDVVPVWAIVLVVAREFLVSGLRMIVASSGTVIAAGTLGKWKTATTMLSLCGYMLVLALPVSSVVATIKFGLDLVFYLAMILTAWSGIDYFIKSKDYLAEE